jgi:hypothetical protein
MKTNVTRNPWPGQDVSDLKITTDPIPEKRSRVVSKYESLFSRMKVGQCIVCDSKSAPNIAYSLNKWVRKNKGEGYGSKFVARYPSDNRGRVWLIERSK